MTATVKISNPNGYDLSFSGLYADLYGAAITTTNATQFTAENTAAGLSFLVQGADLQFGGLPAALTGGTIESVTINQLPPAGTDTLVTITGLAISGAAFSSALQSYGVSGGTDTTGLDAIFLTVPYIAVGGSGNDVIQGGNSNDIIDGRAGDDTLSSGAGNDRLNGGSGLNTMEGGAGNDLYYVNNTTDVIVEASGGGTRDVIYAFSDYTLDANVYVEQIVARLTTGQALTGNELANSLFGNTGNDTLAGGAAADLLDGRGGADDMSGGIGDDRYYVDNANDVLHEGSSEGALDMAYASVDYTLGSGVYVERLYGTGAAGLTLQGNELNNFVFGAAGNDTLFGHDGVDRLIGNGGDDRLVGGAGFDTLFGNAGADVFVLQNLAADRDTIRDFETGDRFEVSASLFDDQLILGVLESQHFTANSTGIAVHGHDRFIYNTTTGALYFDSDGNAGGARIHIATLTGVPTLAASDFFVVA